jgi:hypothetical protein
VIALHAVWSGIVLANVQGSRYTPYRGRIRARTLSEHQWRRAEKAMAAQAVFARRAARGGDVLRHRGGVRGVRNSPTAWLSRLQLDPHVSSVLAFASRSQSSSIRRAVAGLGINPAPAMTVV